MSRQLHILVVPHTHWDREWYQTFQQFRFRLVKTVDKLLKILQDDEHFTHFMLDGQTIVLDDYLEIEPEREPLLKKYISSGRIQVGPWYLQPDEFLVSGESLIRNLQRGIQRARDFGNVMPVGYVPDCFGHIAQLPQLLQGVGIDSAVFWRGVGEEARKSEFYWAAPDGSRVLVIHLADPIGYSNARVLPLNIDEFITRVKVLTASILPAATTDTLLFMNGSDHLEPQEGLPVVIKEANTRLQQLDDQFMHFLSQSALEAEYDAIRLEIGTLPEFVQHVRELQPELQTLSGEMRSSRHAHLLPAVLSTRIWIKQQNSATEHLLERWVEPLTAWATALGAPYPRGLIQTAWKHLLQNHPHDSICGCSIDQVHRENAVRFAQAQQIGESLIQQAMQQIVAEVDTTAPFPAPGGAETEPLPIVVFNPAPGPRTESVQTEVQFPGSLQNAVIVDERGEHMPFRVANRWRQEIGSMPFGREMLSMGIALSGITEPEQLIQMAQSMIMSTLSQESEAHVISRVQIDDPAETQHGQPGVVAVEIMIAPQGRVHINQQEMMAAGQKTLALLEREDIHTFEVTLIDQARETIDFLAADLPGYGYKTFWLYPRGLKLHGTVQREKTVQSSLSAQQYSIENEFYRVEVNERDGTLAVTDKQSNKVFAGLNRFVDGGDVGDLYTYCPPEQDTLIDAPLEPPKVELLHTGPVRSTLRVSGRWSLPSACSASRKERNSRVTVCSISSEISLTAGVPRVDIHTSVENRARDHRLRVYFPVPYKVEEVTVEGTFEVRNRPVSHAVPDNIGEWAEAPVDTFPQKRFIDLSDGTYGLAILNRGLPEYEVVQEGVGVEQGQVAAAITLLRCVEWLSRGDLSTRHGHAGPMEHTPEAQCLGTYEFDYALIPHASTWQADNARVLQQAQAFNTPLTTSVAVAGSHTGQLGSRVALIDIEPPELVVSAIKRSADGQGMVVRLYNPLGEEREVAMHIGVAFTQAYMANLIEEYQQSLPCTDTGEVRFNLRGGGIQTIIVL